MKIKEFAKDCAAILALAVAMFGPFALHMAEIL